MKSKGAMFVFLFFLAVSMSLAYGQGGPPSGDVGGPRFSSGEIDIMIQAQKRTFEIVKKCEQTSFDPPDPEGRVNRIDVVGLVDGKCKLRMDTIKGEVVYMLPEEVYTKISDISDLFKGECSGNCEYGKEAQKAPEPADDGERCVRKCVVRGCSLSSLECEKLNMEKCEDECGMVKGPGVEEMGKEERCIFECVNQVDPGIRCGSGIEGETGNEVCQRCADECSKYYEGPCLTDEQWKQKEQECAKSIGRGWAAEEVYGGSGEGYECVVDVECVSYAHEWGDNPGTGPDNWETNLEISVFNEGTLFLKNGEEEIEVPFMVGEGVELEMASYSRIKLNKDDEEIIIKERSRELISRYAEDEIERINLDFEDGKAEYELVTKKKSKLLGVIPVTERVTKKVDAEDLALIDEDGPWWGFLAVD